MTCLKSHCHEAKERTRVAKHSRGPRGQLAGTVNQLLDVRFKSRGFRDLGGGGPGRNSEPVLACL